MGSMVLIFINKGSEAQRVKQLTEREAKHINCPCIALRHALSAYSLPDIVLGTINTPAPVFIVFVL